MSKTITLADEVHKELAGYGNRDESYNTIVLRVLNNLNEEEAKRDRENRATVFERGENGDELTGSPAIEKLDDGTTVRWKLQQGEYAGKAKTGRVNGGRVEYRDTTWSASGFARAADQDIRGDDARSSESYRGPKEVEYQNEDGDWVAIDTVLEY